MTLFAKLVVSAPVKIWNQCFLYQKVSFYGLLKGFLVQQNAPDLVLFVTYYYVDDKSDCKTRSGFAVFFMAFDWNESPQNHFLNHVKVVKQSMWFNEHVGSTIQICSISYLELLDKIFLITVSMLRKHLQLIELRKIRL